MSEERLQALATALEVLAYGETLEFDEAKAAMADLLSGEATPVQIAALLMGLRVKGESVEEIAGLAEGMRAAMLPVENAPAEAIDLCGTGGDESGTFNISTAASLVVAGAGVPVAKHGNRSASSQCGSADVLEALGVPIELEPERSRAALEQIGFAFLFARLHHPAMRHVAPTRAELGFRTFFNLIGPLTNPAGVTRQLIGVYDDSVRSLVGEVLRRLGSETVWVVHGEGGLDEVSPCGTTRVTAIQGSETREMAVSPEDAGLRRWPLGSLKGGDAEENAGIIERVLSGERGACREATLLNAAAALVIGGSARSLKEGAARAAEAVDSGGAQRVLDALRELA